MTASDSMGPVMGQHEGTAQWDNTVAAGIEVVAKAH